MNNIKLSLVTMVTLGSMAYAGGDFSVITPYEVEDTMLAEEVYIAPEPVYVAPVEEYVEPMVQEYVEPVAEAYVEPVPVYVAPVPVYVAPVPVYVAPVPVAIAPVPVSDINPSGFYAGLGISAARYQSNCKSGCSKSGTDKTGGLMARVGYDFNKYVGIEARGIKTNWKSDGAKVEHAGLFVKPMIPVSDATNIYGLVGVAKTKTKGSMQRTNAEGLALGLGVELDLSSDTPKDGKYGRTFDGKGNQEKGLGVFADYERMLVKSGAPDLDAVSVGVTYDF